jgi:hypothetical protein
MQNNDAMIGKGFATGSHVILRPVLEADLEALAYLLGENPLGLGQDQLPWTAARLKKKFEDSDKPGLWDDNRFTLAVTRKSGELAGFIDCERERNGVHWIALHIREGLADRDELGRDALAAFVALGRKWHVMPKVATALIDGEPHKQNWFADAGFELEIRAEESHLYLGEIRDILIYGWLAESTLANRAPEGIGV